MTQFELALVDAAGLIHRPFMSLNVEDRCVPALLQTIASLQRFIPLRVLYGDKLVTGIETTRDGCQIKGQPIQWLQP